MPNQLKRLRSFLVIFFLFGAVFTLGLQTKWKGSVKIENGLTVVRNPQDPLYGKNALILQEELTIGKPGSPPENIFSEIRQLAVDGRENIYVLDSKESQVKVFAREGKYLRTIGRPGQGPGELDNPRSISISGDEIMVTEASRRLSFFSLAGSYLRTLSTKETWALMAEADSKGDIIVVTATIDPKEPFYSYLKFDGQLNLLFEIARSPAPNASKGYNPFMPISYLRVDKKDNFIYGYPEDYTIQVFNPQGKLIRKITREYTPVEVTEKERKEMMADTPPSIKFNFSKYHSAFRRFVPDDEGRIIVQSWEKGGEEDIFLYDIFDAEGRYIVQVPIKGRPFVALKGRIYVSAEDEEGSPLVIRYAMTWRIPA
jgi:hypothetical protein